MKNLKKKWQKKKRNSKSIHELMDVTVAGRREWIVHNEPPVSEVLDKFPPLTNHDMVCCIMLKVIYILKCSLGVNACVKIIVHSFM